MVVRHVLSGQGQIADPAGPASATAYVGTFGPSGSGAFVTTPNSASLSLGTTSNLTVEWWMYSTAYSYSGWEGCPVCFNASGNVVLRVDTTWNTCIGSIPFTTRAVPPLNVWTHFAVSRSGGTGYVHINGVQYLSAANATDFNLSGSRIGNYNNNTGQEWPGYIAQFRISNIARYGLGSTFTPRILLTSDVNTTFLTLNSSSFVDTGPLNLGALSVTAGTNTPTMTSTTINRTVVG